MYTQNKKMNKRIIALHLPQYYAFPENDAWWGKGFTEWRSCTMAKPRFRGHYEPHIPADLGFYDLRFHECRKAQQDLAKEYGIYGFCYYHYWFSGRRIMELPVEEMLKNKEENFPFMLCWANEDWNRNWEKGRNEILLKHDYNREDDIAHFNYLLPIFKDSRYIRVDGKPVIAIHRTDLFPNIEETVQLWKSMAKENGFELYFCRMEAKGTIGKQYLTPSMDAAIEFQPFRLLGYGKHHNFVQRIINKLSRKTVMSIIYSYKSIVNYNCKRSINSDYKLYPAIVPSWDNSPRREGRPFWALKGSTPALFKKWFQYIYSTFTPFSEEENFIFINAWNEWAEGCHLEPDMKNGLGYLEAIKETIDECK